MSDETTMLPCPFCGGEAEICHARDICRDPQDWYWGKCLSCHISGKHYPTEAEAIAAWNTRTATTIGKVQVEIEPVLHDTLTAEQVKNAWCSNLKRDCLYDPPMPDWQAIADELNELVSCMREFVDCGVCKFYHADIQLCEYGIPPCSKFERKAVD